MTVSVCSHCGAPIAWKYVQGDTGLELAAFNLHEQSFGDRWCDRDGVMRPAAKAWEGSGFLRHGEDCRPGKARS